ncbi:hypothetical protein AB9R08_05670 [Neisseria gonorrhoeae]
MSFFLIRKACLIPDEEQAKCRLNASDGILVHLSIKGVSDRAAL